MFDFNSKAGSWTTHKTTFFWIKPHNKLQSLFDWVKQHFFKPFPLSTTCSLLFKRTRRTRCPLFPVLFNLLYFVHSPIFCSLSYILVNLLYFGYSLICWSPSGSHWFTLLYSSDHSLSYWLKLPLLLEKYQLAQLDGARLTSISKVFKTGESDSRFLLCTLWESGTLWECATLVRMRPFLCSWEPYCALKIIRTPRCLHSLTSEGKIVKSQIGNIICTLLILHCQLHLAQQISYLYLSLYFAFVSVMHLYLYLYLHLYILKRYHLCFVFGKDMMGPVLDVEVDSSETEDRVHQAD